MKLKFLRLKSKDQARNRTAPATGSEQEDSSLGDAAPGAAAAQPPNRWRPVTRLQTETTVTTAAELPWPGAAADPPPCSGRDGPGTAKTRGHRGPRQQESCGSAGPRSGSVLTSHRLRQGRSACCLAGGTFHLGAGVTCSWGFFSLFFMKISSSWFLSIRFIAIKYSPQARKEKIAITGRSTSLFLRTVFKSLSKQLVCCFPHISFYRIYAKLPLLSTVPCTCYFMTAFAKGPHAFATSHFFPFLWQCLLPQDHGFHPKYRLTATPSGLPASHRSAKPGVGI